MTVLGCGFLVAAAAAAVVVVVVAAAAALAADHGFAVFSRWVW